jgi:archaemetzincin
MKISLRPIGNVDKDTLEALRIRLKQTFGCPIEIVPHANALEHTYDPKRGQYLSPGLLSRLEELGGAKDEKVLGVVDADLYAPGLNFVFGQANATTGTAIISLCRLREEYYGLHQDKDKFLERATKEAVHELGHTFGLEHCTDPKCVMHFSNSLQDTDLKQAAFCSQCRPKLIK